MFKIGDFVSRKKYNNDVIFRIVKIDGNVVYLSGVDVRLSADSDVNDLVLVTIRKDDEEYRKIKETMDDKFFYIPGTVLHIDGDSNYLNRCLKYYKSQNVRCFGYVFEESKFEENVYNLLIKHKPNILVITGHDAYFKSTNSYKNSTYFINTVKKARSYQVSHNSLIIISGACQSNFKGLIEAGSTYASSPKHINIHALDPAIIASNIALCDINDSINLENVISQTKYGIDGIGGLKTKGVMLSGFPRKGILN